jgi:hypothetical protein
MKSKYKIAWQKYEDVLEKQFSSPMIMHFMKNMLSNGLSSQNTEEEDDSEDDLSFDDDEEDEELKNKSMVMMPMTENILQELSIVSNFDCWLAHTNFDVTNGIKEKLNHIPGVEVLKIFSRYRFFVGIGKLFDFAEVRQNIENEIIPKEV